MEDKMREQIACIGCGRESDCDSSPTIDGTPKHTRCIGQLKQADRILELVDQYLKEVVS